MLDTNDFLLESLALSFKKVSVWFILSVSFYLEGPSYFYFKGTNLDDFNLLKVFVISLSFPDPIIWMKIG